MNTTINHEQKIGTINVSRDFLTGGHAIFTVSNPAGEHYTYRITTPDDQSQENPIWFVGVLSGPNNDSDYSYLGILLKDGTLRLTKKSKYTEDAQCYKVGKWAIKVVWDGKTIPENYNIIHNGYCGRCGRQLTTPESIKTGIGPICAGKGR